MNEPTADSGAGRIEVVSRAARILKAFDMNNPVLSVRGIAERTGISRSACHTIASTLVFEGLLEARPGGGYQLGQALAPIGAMVLERTGLVERAIPKMETLSWYLGGEVHLAYSSGESLIYLARVRRDRQVRMPNRYGEPMPLHQTGAGWAILTAVDPSLRERVLDSLSEPASTYLKNQIMNFAERGYIVHHNFKIGVCSVASPIRIGPGVVAAISLAQPRPLMDDARIAETGRRVRQVCQSIEEHYTLTSESD